jgi:hypothetical protein
VTIDRRNQVLGLAGIRRQDMSDERLSPEEFHPHLRLTLPSHNRQVRAERCASACPGWTRLPHPRLARVDGAR